MKPEYWHWLVLGMLLALAELFIGTFFIIWAGMAALILGGILYFAPVLELRGQLLVWGGLTLVCTFAWFKWIRPLSPDRTRAGLSKEMFLGEVGLVLQEARDGNRGEMRFPAPIHGTDTWKFLPKDEVHLPKGSRVRVVDIAGNTLIVVSAQTRQEG